MFHKHVIQLAAGNSSYLKQLNDIHCANIRAAERSNVDR